MTLGHEKFDVYHLSIGYIAAMFGRLGRRSCSVRELAESYGSSQFDSDSDSAFEPDENKHWNPFSQLIGRRTIIIHEAR